MSGLPPRVSGAMLPLAGVGVGAERLSPPQIIAGLPTSSVDVSLTGLPQVSPSSALPSGVPLMPPALLPLRRLKRTPLLQSSVTSRLSSLLLLLCNLAPLFPARFVNCCDLGWMLPHVLRISLVWLYHGIPLVFQWWVLSWMFPFSLEKLGEWMPACWPSIAPG
ncbi:hypothetical protein Nepgr_001110 [Nepenthes gracilis]|uniref:Uncharacterized protein n=1 Tax=Nepenthes gracilis TaxID=150966 RepID=A0AAD3RX42_NEPGR|nr:hypothetical protein Nepgr_001110 [Nepenthes gracilis]